MIDSLRAAFISRGIDPVTATRKAYAVLFGMVEQQSSMLSFNYVFGFMTLVFLCMIPLIFILRRPQRKVPTAAH